MCISSYMYTQTTQRQATCTCTCTQITHSQVTCTDTTHNHALSSPNGVNETKRVPMTLFNKQDYSHQLVSQANWQLLIVLWSQDLDKQTGVGPSEKHTLGKNAYCEVIPTFPTRSKMMLTVHCSEESGWIQSTTSNIHQICTCTGTRYM